MSDSWMKATGERLWPTLLSGFVLTCFVGGWGYLLVGLSADLRLLDGKIAANKSRIAQSDVFLQMWKDASPNVFNDRETAEFRQSALSFLEDSVKGGTRTTPPPVRANEPYYARLGDLVAIRGRIAAYQFDQKPCQAFRETALHLCDAEIALHRRIADTLEQWQGMKPTEKDSRLKEVLSDALEWKAATSEFNTGCDLATREVRDEISRIGAGNEEIESLNTDMGRKLIMAFAGLVAASIIIFPLLFLLGRRIRTAREARAAMTSASAVPAATVETHDQVPVPAHKKRHNRKKGN